LIPVFRHVLSCPCTHPLQSEFFLSSFRLRFFLFCFQNFSFCFQNYLCKVTCFEIDRNSSLSVLTLGCLFPPFLLVPFRCSIFKVLSACPLFWVSTPPSLLGSFSIISYLLPSCQGVFGNFLTLLNIYIFAVVLIGVIVQIQQKSPL